MACYPVNLYTSVDFGKKKAGLRGLKITTMIQFFGSSKATSRQSFRRSLESICVKVSLHVTIVKDVTDRQDVWSTNPAGDVGNNSDPTGGFLQMCLIDYPISTSH